jgi:putative membrane protein
MWHYGNPMGFFGWTMMILFWVVVVALIIWAVRSSGTTRDVPRSDALALLERRFAAGEIEQDEFQEKKRLLKEI